MRLVTICIVVLFVATSLTFAQLPRTISVQGMLVDPAGKPVADGNKSFALSLYETANGGVPVFSEVDAVAVSGGICNIIIGSSSPLPATLKFDRQYYLGISIDGGAELTPRTPLTASPYALHAAIADMALTLDPSAPNVVTSVNGLSGALTLQGSGATTVSNAGNVITIDGFALPYTGTIASAGTAVSVTNAGSGYAITGTHSDTAGINPAIRAESNSMDASATALYGIMNSTSPGGFSAAVRGVNNGTGGLGIGVSGSHAGGGWGVYGSSVSGIGVNGNSPSGAGVLGGSSTGTGVYGMSEAGFGVYGKSTSLTAGRFEIVDAANASAALEGATNGSGPAANISTTGTGSAGSFTVGNANSTAEGIRISSSAKGVGAIVQLTNPASTASGVTVTNAGTGSGVTIQLTNASNGARGVDVVQSGVGPGVFATSAGGNAVWGITSSISAAGVIGDNTFGEAVVGRNRGGNGVGAVVGRNDSSGYGVRGFNTKDGYGVIGQAGISGGAGVGGRFENVNAASAASALEAVTNGAGNALLANQTNATLGNIAVFQSVSVNKARIDKTGKGFFNGGTQVGGADMAEAFAVVGDARRYEPGDVLEIAEGYTRTVRRSSRAYATTVMGVYATKPGMLMSERDVEARMDDLVPTGVVGVIPTKVCSQGGAIRAGDLLVTSSKPGRAMKADPRKLRFGMVLGKALEDFDGREGVIEVFVNAK